MAFSRRTRFEILERDGHTCQSCGRTPPQVKLTADHVIPEALGGSNAPSNGQALCAECNAGKSSRQPDAATVAAVDAKAAQWADAMKRVAEQERADLAKSGEFANLFDKYWCGWTNGIDEPIQRADGWEQSVLAMRDAGMDIDGLYEAVRIAMAAKHIKNYDTWRYFCGVVWRRLEQRQAAARQLLESDQAQPAAPTRAPGSSAHEAELGAAYAEAYEDMERRAESLEGEEIAYWLLESDYPGDQFHRPQGWCFAPVRLLEALFNERISGHKRDVAVEQTVAWGEPTFCVWCCREEADLYNPKAAGGDA